MQGEEEEKYFMLSSPTGGTVTGGICVAADCETEVPDKVLDEVWDEVQDLWPGTAKGSRIAKIIVAEVA